MKVTKFLKIKYNGQSRVLTRRRSEKVHTRLIKEGSNI